MTKVTGPGQANAYSFASALAGEPGDVVFSINNANDNYILANVAMQTVRIRTRVYVNPVGLTFGTNDQFNILYFRGTSFTNRTHRMYIGNASGVFGLLPLSYAEGSTLVTSVFTPITKAAFLLETDFLRSSVFGANDAVYTVYVNGVQVYQRAGFSNFTSFGLVNQCWIGGAAEIDAGTSGDLIMGKVLITNNTIRDGEYTPPAGNKNRIWGRYFRNQ